MKPEINKLLQRSPMLWRGRGTKRNRKGLQTGYDNLDAILPESGWPGSAIVEVFNRTSGIGEISLFLPAMASLTTKRYRVVWIAPPWIPYAPALKQAGIDLAYLLVVRHRGFDRNCLWSMEKFLQTPGCGMVLCWPSRLSMTAVRRLQLACEAGQSMGVLFNSTPATYSSASLSLVLQAGKPLASLNVEILKSRGTSRYTSTEIVLSGH